MFRSLSTAVLLLLLALPGVALAQNTGKLSGRVTDADTGEPLIGANVYIADAQRGAATDIDGNYTILGLPVGQYDIQYSYTGYQAQTLTGVEISQGRTRTVDIELSPQSIGEVVVEYERPLIQRDAIGVPKVATGEDIQNLPVRGVSSVAAIQSGVVSNDGSSTLNIRGGRGEEVAYYVDGVKVLGGSPAIPQQAIAEQEMLIGTIPPQYGDATAGVISISTQSGGNNFFGSAEAITSYGLDAYGYNLGSLSLGGPILRDKVSFFTSIQGTYAEDSSPYALETLQLRDDLYNQIQDSPQVVRVSQSAIQGATLTVDPLFQDEEFAYLPFPEGLTLPMYGDTPAVPTDSLASLLGLASADDVLAIRNAYSFFSSPDQFTTRSSKDDPSTQISTLGNLEFRPVQGVNIRLGGAYTYSENSGFSYDRSFFNRDRFSTSENENVRGYLSLRQVLSNTAFYQIQAEYSTRDFLSYPEEFGGDIRDVLSYGDIDAPQNSVAARYYVIDEVDDPASADPDDVIPAYVRQFSDGNLGVSSSLGFVFSGPGTPLSNYQQFEQDQFRVFGSAQTQVGVHELSFGGEYETLTQRNWSVGGGARAFARYLEDADGATPLFQCDDTGEADFEAAPSCLSGDDFRGDGDPTTLDAGIDSYDQLPFDQANIEGIVNYYGYDYLGLNEVDDQSLEGYANGTNYNIAPYKPIYYGGFLRDRVEFQDIVLDLGLRVDVFDNNTLVLKDPYALVDIYRVEDLSSNITDGSGNVLVNAPSSIPGNIEGDFAFYQNGGNVVGYRDLQGRFYDANGQQVATPGEVKDAGSPLARASGLSEGAFEDYDPALTVMPRVGVTFPITDRALFFASYNVTSQRPSENAFETIRGYSRVANSSGTLNNANLRPETTTQYELGFRQRIGQQAALTLSGFYRTQRNKVTLRNLNDAFPAGYTTYTNLDFTTTKGVELAFDLRRTRNLAVNANYTLSFAEGTGSDSRTARIIAWRSQTEVFPETLAPLNFDRRHNLNISLDYRLGREEGPMIGGVHPLAGFGFNLLGVVQSGSPYTELDEKALESLILQSTNGGAVGQVNSVYLPFSSRLDLKVDRAFNLGPAAFRGYVWVQNLLDQQQVYSVYRDTGLPDDDGFLSTNPDAVRALPTELEREAFRFLYSQYVASPVVLDGFGVSGGQFYGLPRRIRLGVTLDF